MIIGKGFSCLAEKLTCACCIRYYCDQLPSSHKHVPLKNIKNALCNSTLNTALNTFALVLCCIQIHNESYGVSPNKDILTSLTLRLSTSSLDPPPRFSYRGTSPTASRTIRAFRPVISATLPGPPRASIISSRGLKLQVMGIHAVIHHFNLYTMVD